MKGRRDEGGGSEIGKMRLGIGSVYSSRKPRLQSGQKGSAAEEMVIVIVWLHWWQKNILSVSAAATEDSVEFPADDMIGNLGSSDTLEREREKEVQSNLYGLPTVLIQTKRAEPKSNLTVKLSV